MHSKLTETLSKYKKIILVGGGTGGHVQPIVSVINYLRDSEYPTLQRSHFLWIGGTNSQEETAARENNVKFTSIRTLKLATTRSPKILLYPIVLIQGILQARKILQKEILASQEGQNHDSSPNPPTDQPTNGPIAIFSKGGPGSVAIGIAAWILRIPLYIHESDTIPGRSNRILGRFATKIFLGFESAKKYFNPEKCETIGQILHPVFSDSHCEPAKQSRKIERPLDRLIPRDDKNQIHWRTNKKHLLVICGSQGARVIFEEILQNLKEILEKYEIILILGKLNTDMRSDFEQKLRTLNPESGPLNLVDWISQSNLAHLIPDTNIAITRGSATTLAELTSLRELRVTNHGLRMIIIPLPHAANNHQYWNAKEYENMGHTLLEQKVINNLTHLL